MPINGKKITIATAVSTCIAALPFGMYLMKHRKPILGYTCFCASAGLITVGVILLRKACFTRKPKSDPSSSTSEGGLHKHSQSKQQLEDEYEQLSQDLIENPQNDNLLGEGPQLNVEPIEVISQDVEPIEVTSQDVEPIEVTSQDVEPIEVIPQDLEPIQAIPQAVEPIHAIPQAVEPIHAIPQDVEPIHAIPQDVEPIHAIPQDVEAIHAIPQDVEAIQAIPQDVEAIPAIPQDVEAIQAAGAIPVVPYNGVPFQNFPLNAEVMQMPQNAEALQIIPQDDVAFEMFPPMAAAVNDLDPLLNAVANQMIALQNAAEEMEEVNPHVGG